MDFVYLLEDEPKFQKQIVEAISAVNPKIQVRLFPKLENFVSWTKFMMTVGVKAIAQGGQVPTFLPATEVVTPDDSDRLLLVISKMEYFGAEQLGLLRRTQTLFLQRGLCDQERPTSFVLTAFDDSHFSIKPFQNEILSNIIFKPFDRLILIQHLTIAIEGRRPPSKSSVVNQKTTAVLELLKDVPVEAISDVGLVTKSDREIAIGSVAKYYGKVFLSDQQRSLFAVCQKCVPHPTEPGIFRGTYTFFAADQNQISTVRKLTRGKAAKDFPFDWKTFAKASPDRDLNVVILEQKESSQTAIAEYLPRRFEGVKILPYDNFSTFLADLDPNQALKSQDPNLKALDGALEVTLSFDRTGVTYLGMESNKKGQDQIFGVSNEVWKSKSNWFSLALSTEHRAKYRKYIQTGKLIDDNVLSVTVGENSFLVKVIDLKNDDNKFQFTISELSKEQQILWYEKNARLRGRVHLIIASHRLFGEGARERWAEVKEILKRKYGFDPVIMMTVAKGAKDSEKREWGEYVQDICLEPLDKVYFFQKIKSFFPLLMEKVEKVEIKSMVFEDTIKAVNPVTVIEISEAGFTIQYNRPIAIGSFREIVLWQSSEIEAPQLLASCNSTEEDANQKGVFKCQFVFFGITDASLKHIRIWMRDNYILSKDTAS